MEPLNRIALLVTPKRRFMEWANRLPDTGEPLRPEELPSLGTVYLIAGGALSPDLQEMIDVYREELFEEFLASWVTDESQWPANRTSHTFRDWFSVELIESVTDLDPREPIMVSEAVRTQCAMCGDRLSDPVIGVAAGATVRRVSTRELDEWEQARADGREPSIDADLIFRCCSEACATQAEETLQRAHEKQRGGVHKE